MAAIWSPETRFRIWFEIEAHAADAMAELGMIPKDAAKTIWAKGKAAKFDAARGGGDLRDLRRGWHFRARGRPRRSLRCGKIGAHGRAHFNPDHPARPACHVFRHASGGRRLMRAPGNGNSSPAAHRSAGSRG